MVMDAFYEKEQEKMADRLKMFEDYAEREKLRREKSGVNDRDAAPKTIEDPTGPFSQWGECDELTVEAINELLALQDRLKQERYLEKLPPDMRAQAEQAI